MRLLRFIHADLRRNGVKCYFANKPQLNLADLATQRAALLDDLEDA